MSLSQMIAQTLLEFRADTSQARQEIKKLAGEERKAAEDTLAANEKRNASYERIAAGITKVNTALGVVSEGIRFAADAWKVYDEVQDLAGASSLYSIEGLRKASRGLVTDMNLMKLAAASQASTFKLTQSQLENATKAMRAFEKSGFDSVDVQAKIQQAILKGSIEPLKELGVNLKVASTSTERYNQLLAVLADKAGEAGDAELDRGDKMKQTITSYENAITELQSSVGELVLAFEPLIKVAAEVAASVAKVVKAIPAEILTALALAGAGAYGAKRLGGMAGAAGAAAGATSAKSKLGKALRGAAVVGTAIELGEALGAAWSEWDGTADEIRAQQARAAEAQEQIAQAQNAMIAMDEGVLQTIGAMEAKADAAFQRQAKRLTEIKDTKNYKSAFQAFMSLYSDDPAKVAALTEQYESEMRRRRMAAANARGKGKGLEPLRIEREIRDQEIIFEDQEYRGEAFAYEGPAIPQAPAGKSMFEYEASSTRQRMEADLAAISEQARLAQADLIAAATGMEKAWLESTFGPLEDFDAYGRAFQGLSSIITDTFSQWTQGADITAASLKKMTGALLGSLATEMTAKSIQHAAYAVGSLFLPGQQAAAAGHAAAAAKFAAGAVVIGGLARSMSGSSTTAGAGAGSTGGGYGSGGAASVGGGTERDMGRITNLYVGDVFSDDNPRTQRQKFARIQRAARRELDTAGGVEFR